MKIQAIYLGTAIAVSVKNFDPSDSMHIMLKNMLEQKGFKSEENPNTWIRRSFKSWDNYQFWQAEVDKLVNHFTTQNEPEPQPSPNPAPPPVQSTPQEPLDLEKVADKIKKLFALSQSIDSIPESSKGWRSKNARGWRLLEILHQLQLS